LLFSKNSDFLVLHDKGQGEGEESLLRSLFSLTGEYFFPYVGKIVPLCGKKCSLTWKRID